MDITRRNFVKLSAIAAASAAAAGSLAGCAPTKNQSIDKDSVETKVGVCRFCGCGCGVLIEVRDGKIITIKGDPANDSSRGLNCVKGYYLAKILKGKDRLTKPLIRKDASSKGSNDSNLFREATWDEALELVADKLRTTWKNDKKRLAFYGSGQQPILEGYCTSKFWKAGLLSNNIDPNARLCMASAVVGFMNTFQTDEPAGCYADIDTADLFITWGANMAECHPMLFSRVTARKQQDHVKHFDLTTVRNRTSATADRVMVFKPNTDLAITNCICNYLIENKLYDEQFVKDHLQFKHGQENIGNNDFEHRDTYDTSEQGKTADATTQIDFAEFGKLVSPYTLEYTSELSGVSVDDLTALCEAFADPNLKITSFWTMGVNQHNRGTWMNQNLYNVHMLVGKIAKPGNGPFSLTGQPSACGTAREVGTFSHRLPGGDLVVNNEQHRRYTEAVWNLPEGYLEPISTVGFHTTKIFREMSNGNMDFIWSAHNNWAQAMTDLNRFLGRDGEHNGIFNTFIVVSEVYPTLSTAYADVVLPAAMWIEREGMFGNGERRTAVFEKCIEPPSDARWDLWMLMEIAWRVLKDEKIGDQDAFDCLFGKWYDKEKRDWKFATQREVCREIHNEYRTFGSPDPATNPYANERTLAINTNADNKFSGPLKMEAKMQAPYDEYIYQHGLTWPVREVDGKWYPTKWRFNGSGSQQDGYDQLNYDKYGDKGLADDICFYKSTNHRPTVCFHPYEPPAEVPDEKYPWVMVTGRLLEHWHTGTMTRRVPELLNALPQALMDMCDSDMQKIGVKDGDRVKVTSRWGSFECTVSSAGRTQPGPGLVYIPFFDEDTLCNMAQQEVYCPLSKEPDYKKTCVNIEKVETKSK